jgi:hypothetical protein
MQRVVVWIQCLLCVGLLSACAPAPIDAPNVAAPDAATAPLACQNDSQCTVKNVGNCCGEFLACVHVEQTVDPAAVKRRCEAEGLSSVCGQGDIAGCRCDSGRCVESAAITIDLD